MSPQNQILESIRQDVPAALKGREWASTRELADLYGHSVDFYQKLAGSGAVEAKRHGLGPRARIMINLSSFLRYWDYRPDGAQWEKTTSASLCVAKFTTRANAGRAKNLKPPSILRMRALLASGHADGSQV